MSKFKNRYRITSARAPFWDYGSNAAYFVTICTHNRAHWFGNVVDGVMQLSTIARIANACWHEIPDHFPFVELGSYVVMPNHVHGVVIINKPIDVANPINDDTPIPDTETNPPQNRFGPQSKNLASIIRGFKIGVTKNARQINAEFAWQSRFHDHIIRNEKSFRNICNYIVANPANWQKDKFFNNPSRT